MGIKTFNPYTPSRRHMTGSDFAEITKSTPMKSLIAKKKKTAGRNNQGKSQLDITVVVQNRNIELSTSREMQKMVFQQQLKQSNTIQTEQQTSH